MICHKCGARIDDRASFCQNCGAAVGVRSGTPRDATVPDGSYEAPVGAQAPAVAEPSAWGWFKRVLTQKYATFQGRASRKEYWYFTLVFALIWIALLIADAATGTLDEALGIGLLSGVWMLACLVPNVAVAVRRLHDTGRTGWWFLLSLVPLVGPIVVFVFCALDSEPGSNRYGPNPKESLGT